MPFDWKITTDKKKEVTTLVILHPNGGGPIVTGTGKDIWEARENAIEQTHDVAVLDYITKHVWFDIE